MLGAWLEWKVNQMVRRTEKKFVDYNEYRDRPFGLKWGTAYAMAELVTGIKQNEAWATKENEALPLMEREEIDLILSESFLYNTKVSIQLNTRDDFGRLLDNLEGVFIGEAYEDYFVFNDRPIYWSDVRHIEIKKEEKWFAIDYFQNEQRKKEKLSSAEDIQIEKNEFFQPFPEEG